MSTDKKKLHESYVADLAVIFEKQGYKIILEGGIPQYRKKEWGEPDIFVLKKENSRLILEKVVEVSIVDQKEGNRPDSVLIKCRKIKEYYDPPQLIVFEPTGYTSNYYSPSLGKFTNYDEYNAYLQEKWKKEGLNVIFWNEWDLEEQRKCADSRT